MPKEKLNLLQLTATVVTQFRTSSSQIMRCDVLQAGSLAAGSDHVPDNVLRDALGPYLSFPRHRSEDFALTNACDSNPLVERGFHACRDGNSTNVPALANEIDHGPMSLPHLDVVQVQTD